MIEFIAGFIIGFVITVVLAVMVTKSIPNFLKW